MKKIILFSLSLIYFGLNAQTTEQLFQAAGTPENPKVNINFNRYYSSEGLEDIEKQIAKAHPNLAKLKSIGKSTEGRDIWMLEVTNFKEGIPDKKPGYYVDGNIHSNEIQGAELSIYIAWYLTEMHEKSKFIKELLNDKVFYIVPTLNPDARNNYMYSPNSMHSPRSGMIVIDDDLDGIFDEDGYDDLDGDNSITQMWRRSPTGNWIKDPKDPRRMLQIQADDDISVNRYEYLGSEGLDNDGDGAINEDVIGYYDPNRDWAWKWQPDYIQNGAYKYPFSAPETRAVANFVINHPNIAGAQTFHNNGGLILRGPGVSEDIETYNQVDINIYDQIGKKGEKMLPGYKYIVIYKDLYSTFGSEIDWFHGDRGIFTFSNEIFTSYAFFNEENPNQDSTFDFSKYLLFDDAFTPYSKVNHPTYGEIEVGGFKKNFTRATPGFLLEEEAHRNMAFVIYHAYHLPKLSIIKVDEKDIGNGLSEITATILNERIMPTHSSHDVQNQINRPDYISISGVDVVSGMIISNLDFNVSKEQINQPSNLKLSNIPGMNTVTVRWIVKKGKKYKITVDSLKGGFVEYSK
jgi:hypothetical protein